MTRKQAIERAASTLDGKYTCDNLALHEKIAASAYDAAYLAGLRWVLDNVLSAACTCHEGFTSRKLRDPECRYHDDTVAVLAEIDRVRKGAKAK